MKITKVTICNFKRFREETFEFGDSIVLAGPNNSGKTTLLQAIATWWLALERWRELNNCHRRGGAYAKAPISRQAFHSVPLRAFDLLWNQRTSGKHIEIEVTIDYGVSPQHIPVEVIADTSEQVYVRPRKDTEPELLLHAESFPQPVFVPAMTGLGTEEPVYQVPKINQLLGQGKPGDVLRNLLVEIHHDQKAWMRLAASIDKMFGYELLPPDTRGPNILAEYREKRGGGRLDIASAGSGFLQVLMLLTFMHSRRNTVLLLDEPDAHLHVILQDRIYTELRAAARESDSQLVIATHSEVVINSVDPRELCAVIGTPKKLIDKKDRASLIRSLSALSNMDIMLARGNQSILYVEGHTDFSILREWANVLGHRVQIFMANPFWKPSVSETRLHGKGIKAWDHFESMLLAQNDMRGVQISDGDGKQNVPARAMDFDGQLLKLCWARYEIENYLVHPAVLARFVGMTAGENSPLADIDNMRNEMRKHLPGAAVDEPLKSNAMFDNTKMRESILPAILEAAKIFDLPYTRYAEIAALMQPGEIHPEITEKLDAIADHFKL
ncbi:MAG: ATP-binding protein [Gammaproteobacteria bacterium]